MRTSASSSTAASITGRCLRAAGQFVMAGGRIVSGGSTLTMQVARLIQGEPTRGVDGEAQPDPDGAEARGALQQGSDPHPLSDARAVWRQSRRGEGGEPRLFRQGADAADRRRGGAPRRAAAIAGGATARSRPGRRTCRAQPRARPPRLRGRARRGGGDGRQDRAGADRATHLSDARGAPCPTGGGSPPDGGHPHAYRRPRPAGLARDAGARPGRRARAQTVDRHRCRRSPHRRDPRLGRIRRGCWRKNAPAMSI